MLEIQKVSKGLAQQVQPLLELDFPTDQRNRHQGRFFELGNPLRPFRLILCRGFMHVALNWFQLSDNVHASFQSATATFAHPFGCAAL